MNSSDGPAFARYIGIDYSGAETPTSSLKGLRVYLADRTTPPEEVLPPPSPRKYWTRRGIAEWLVERLSEDPPTLVGIDHGFSFPLRYFEAHHLPPDWPAFLEDFQRHWPTDEDHTYVDFVRYGSVGNGAERMGDPRWRRLMRDPRPRRQVRLPVRRPGPGRQVHPRRPALAALSAPPARRPGPLLALRRLADPARALGGGRGLPRPLEARLPHGRPHPGPARRLFRRRLAAPGRPRRPPARIPNPLPDGHRAHCGRGGGVDSRRCLARP